MFYRNRRVPGLTATGSTGSWGVYCRLPTLSIVSFAFPTILLILHLLKTRLVPRIIVRPEDRPNRFFVDFSS